MSTEESNESSNQPPTNADSSPAETTGNGAVAAPTTPASSFRRPHSPPTNHGVVTFEPRSGVSASQAHHHHVLFNEPHHHPGQEHELMGPILRRKKVVSMPLGAGGDFFYYTASDHGGPHLQLMEEAEHHPRVKQKSHDPNRQRQYSDDPHRRQRQVTPPAFTAATSAPVTPPHRRRVKQDSWMSGLVHRKQVSLDLLRPNEFFGVPPEEEEELVAPPGLELLPEEQEAIGEIPPEEALPTKRLFLPLRFAPRVVHKKGRGGSRHGAGDRHGAAVIPPTILEQPEEPGEQSKTSFARYKQAKESLKQSVLELQAKSPEQSQQLMDKVREMEQEEEHFVSSQLWGTGATTEKLIKSKEDDAALADKEKLIEDDHNMDGEKPDDKLADDEKEDEDIIRASKSDKIQAGILFVLMLAITLVVTLWDTHSAEDEFILRPVGLACVTDCLGNTTTRDFFHGHNHFKDGEVIQLIMHLDPNEEGHEAHAHAVVKIVGVETGQVKATSEFGPVEPHDRMTYTNDVVADFDHLDEPHIINVGVEDGNGTTIDNVELSFTLLANVQTPLSDWSVLVAALVMVAVYLFILIEVIHRTLVAIFGSMIALMLFFIMNGGHTESIRIIMLNLEWSTLGLLFGMMLIVGELSHTGVFEWSAVRILILSKGSFVRLLFLLCTLTAIASAFLDNVTTMLLIAPVTIDMCNILDVDPRPYLISEVLLSNVGGTATLIGDPPNIIIGSSFSDIIGFVDFITEVLPCIFIFCIPAALFLCVWIYRYYLTSTKMRVLDTSLLKKTYPIYDEPRLMIAGTVTFFVIIMFFLHPVHHKDTAWIALLGAFVTIAFTNPHDVQDALRNHIEWDTLLFFAGLFVLVEVCAAMGLLEAIGDALAKYIEAQEESKQLGIAITLIMWVSAITSAFLDNIPYTATMIPVITILAEELPETLSLTTLAWALSFGACLGGNGTLLGASANIVTAGISTNKGFDISFLNFLYPGMLTMITTVAISNLYMLVRYVWAA